MLSSGPLPEKRAPGTPDSIFESQASSGQKPNGYTSAGGRPSASSTGPCDATSDLKAVAQPIAGRSRVSSHRPRTPRRDHHHGHNERCRRDLTSRRDERSATQGQSRAVPPERSPAPSAPPGAQGHQGHHQRISHQTRVAHRVDTDDGAGGRPARQERERYRRTPRSSARGRSHAVPTGSPRTTRTPRAVPETSVPTTDEPEASRIVRTARIPWPTDEAGGQHVPDRDHAPRRMSGDKGPAEFGRRLSRWSTTSRGTALANCYTATSTSADVSRQRDEDRQARAQARREWCRASSSTPPRATVITDSRAFSQKTSPTTNAPTWRTRSKRARVDVQRAAKNTIPRGQLQGTAWTARAHHSPAHRAMGENAITARGSSTRRCGPNTRRNAAPQTRTAPALIAAATEVANPKDSGASLATSHTSRNCPGPTCPL